MDNANIVGQLRSNPSNLSDHEVLYADYVVHYCWQRGHNDGFLPFKPCTFEDLLGLHTLIRAEMDRRGYRHLISDELDSQTPPLKQSRPVVEAGWD